MDPSEREDMQGEQAPRMPPPSRQGSAVRHPGPAMRLIGTSFRQITLGLVQRFFPSRHMKTHPRPTIWPAAHFFQ